MEERLEFEIEVKERLVKIEVMLNSELDSLKKRIAKLEANQEWIIRLVLGSLVGGILALLY